MLRIAVVDDSVEICEIVQNTLQRLAATPISVTCYTNPELLGFDVQEKYTYDVYFLDVEMPYVNGIQLAKNIRSYQHNAKIIFLTSHAKFAIHGYDMDIQAEYFVVKSRMNEYLPKIMKSIEKEMADETQYYIIENNVKFIRIALSEILYARKDNKNVILITEHGNYDDRISLREFAEKVNSEEFVKIERGYIINVRQIREVSAHTVTMKNGDVLFISRDTKKRFRGFVNTFWGHELE